METSILRRPVIQAADEQFAAYAGLGRMIYFRLAAAGRPPCIDCTSQGPETCGRLTLTPGCKGLVRILIGAGKEWERPGVKPGGCRVGLSY